MCVCEHSLVYKHSEHEVKQVQLLVEDSLLLFLLLWLQYVIFLLFAQMYNDFTPKSSIINIIFFFSSLPYFFKYCTVWLLSAFVHC